MHSRKRILPSSAGCTLSALPLPGTAAAEDNPRWYRRLRGHRSGIYRPGLTVLNPDQCQSWSSRNHPNHLQTQESWEKKNNFQAIKSNLYNPVTVPLAELQIKEKLWPTLSSGQVPSTQWSQIWSQGEEAPMVNSSYGMVPKGSVLSYQCPATKEVRRVGPAEPPPLTLPELPPYAINLACSQNQLDHVASLGVTEEEAREYEAHTRQQGQCPEWYKLRKCRLTASNFKRVTGRRSNHQQLALDLFNKSVKKTPAMEFGTENETYAAETYAESFGFDIHEVGFIINPTRPYLGCSPDRRVYDPADDGTWGLLEVKCSTKDSIQDLPFFRTNDDANLELRHSHRYYEQIMGQMGLTGAPWCDFFVWTQNDFHRERIHYDHTFSWTCWRN